MCFGLSQHSTFAYLNKPRNYSRKFWMFCHLIRLQSLAMAHAKAERTCRSSARQNELFLRHCWQAHCRECDLAIYVSCGYAAVWPCGAYQQRYRAEPGCWCDDLPYASSHTPYASCTLCTYIVQVQVQCMQAHQASELVHWRVDAYNYSMEHSLHGRRGPLHLGNNAHWPNANTDQMSMLPKCFLVDVQPEMGYFLEKMWHGSGRYLLRITMHFKQGSVILGWALRHFIHI